MGLAIAEVEGSLRLGESLSDKDRAGLVNTTAAKTLVVLLAPPPQNDAPEKALEGAAGSGRSAASKASVGGGRLGLVAVVVHAKEVYNILG
jgi:hypothetical protein